LNDLYLPYYDALCSNLNANKWAPYFGFRTFAEQGILYAQGRTTPGPVVTHAPPGASPHEYGCATDWAYFDDSGMLVWLQAHDQRWDEYFQAVTDSRLTAGVNFSSPDTDHNELSISDSWSEVLKAYNQGGSEKALAFIKQSHQDFLEGRFKI
jgi:hypothetical protein